MFKQIEYPGASYSNPFLSPFCPEKSIWVSIKTKYYER
jgi:hypothetical protein|tara:strand:- start:594 stop:707 length:114 start_codon:yes stop_codon:yes gene_type:complete